MLNRLWQAVNICSARRAFSLVYAGHAQIVSSDDANNFRRTISKAGAICPRTRPIMNRSRRSRSRSAIPRVIVLLVFDRLPKKEVKFTRHNVFERDKNTCQYCGQLFDRSDLNLDHIVPRDRGGTTTWENVVCSCIPCNTRKGNRLPQRSTHDLDPQTEAAEVASICSDHFFCAPARYLEALRRSRVLERRTERLSVAHSALNR